MDYSSFEQIDKKIAKLKRKEEFFVNSVKIKKQKYEEACKSLEETRNEIVLEEHKRAAIAFGHAGQDQGLQGHSSQIVGNTSTGVETLSGKMKQKMRLGDIKGHARFRGVKNVRGKTFEGNIQHYGFGNMVSSSVPHIAGYPLGLNLYGGYHQQPDFQFSASHEGHFNQGTSHHGNFVNDHYDISTGMQSNPGSTQLNVMNSTDDEKTESDKDGDA
uniref:Uncharacterized protein n=1 Tax=Meloidogyne incognita TaxID=6306 RepID=A0A914MTS8_MELIC